MADKNHYIMINGQKISVGSFNSYWKKYAQVCTLHLDYHRCDFECKKEALWDVVLDIHNHTGAEVAYAAFNALSMLATRGITPPNCIIWQDGHIEHAGNVWIEQPARACLETLAYRIHKLLLCALVNYNEVFIVD